MTLKRTEMARGTTPLRNTKPMSRTAAMARGTATLSRGTGFERGGVGLQSAGNIKETIGIVVLAKPKTIASSPRKRPMKVTRPKMTAIGKVPKTRNVR